MTIDTVKQYCISIVDTVIDSRCMHSIHPAILTVLIQVSDAGQRLQDFIGNQRWPGCLNVTLCSFHNVY